MQYPQETATDGAYYPVIKPIVVADQPEISQTRRKLMILIGVVFGLVGSAGIVHLVGLFSMDSVGRKSAGLQFSQCVVCLIFYGFGFRVAQKYHPIGLLVFAWLGVIGLVGASILVLGLIVLFIGTLTAAHHDPDSNGLLIGLSVAAIIMAVLCVIDSVMTLIIVRWAFKLARLVDANKHTPTASMKI